MRYGVLLKTAQWADIEPTQRNRKAVRNLSTLSVPDTDSDLPAAAPLAPARTAMVSVLTAGEPTSAPGSPWLGAADADPAPLPSGPVPATIGTYRILALLGEGGMGVVYRAQQTGVLRRDVALKLVKRGIDTDRVVERFERERRVLARLDHPNIARVLDAGATDDGRPYFVMELVEGERVTSYCDAARLDVDARLSLFLDICQAVRHAHQRGVLHRDLKPSNVLVVPVDGRPVPKVIDFGIAKVMDDTEDQTALDTRQSGQAIGTPAYMSPEQAGRIDTGVDTRTDVYSLGVLLYELLTGHHPRDFAPHDPQSTSSGRRPSEAVVRTLAPPIGDGTADALAEYRRSTPQRLRRRLAGDLDTVVLKAIELEPDRRYDSVEQFADDVRRVIAREPVRAKPPTWAYRTRRFVRRHRVSVAAAAVGAFVLAGGTGLLAWQRVEIGRERDRAREAERRAALDASAANQVTDFLIGLFEVANPEQSGGKVMTAREMLDAGAARVRSELQDAPPVKARLLTAMGGAYMGLHQDHAAERLLQDALSMRESMPAEPDRQLFETVMHLSWIRARRGEVQAALSYSRRAGAVADRLEATPGRLHAEVWNNLALIQMQAGEFEPARQTLEKALAVSLKQSLADPTRKDGRIHHNLGSALYELGRLDEAAAHFAQAEAAFRHAGRASKDLRSNLVAAASARGLVLHDLKRPDEARRVLDAGVAEARQVYREPHPSLATILNNLALVEQDQKDYAGAETHFREVLQIDRAVSGERHADVASDLHNLAWFLHKYRGRSAEAEQVSRQAVAMRRDLLGAQHPHTASSVRQLADILSGRGQYATAVPLYRESLRVQTATLPRGHRLTLLAALGLGEALTALGQRADAVRVLDDALGAAPVQTPPAKIRVELEAALAKARVTATRRARH
jgi:serine/threonine protein kinase/tetratricopeptide (TPR) repeat protein